MCANVRAAWSEKNSAVVTQQERKAALHNALKEAQLQQETLAHELIALRGQVAGVRTNRALCVERVLRCSLRGPGASCVALMVEYVLCMQTQMLLASMSHSQPHDMHLKMLPSHVSASARALDCPSYKRVRENKGEVHRLVQLNWKRAGSQGGRRRDANDEGAHCGGEEGDGAARGRADADDESHPGRHQGAPPRLAALRCTAVITLRCCLLRHWRTTGLFSLRATLWA